jgi:hypothetical protein
MVSRTSLNPFRTYSKNVSPYTMACVDNSATAAVSAPVLLRLPPPPCTSALPWPWQFCRLCLGGAPPPPPPPPCPYPQSLLMTWCTRASVCRGLLTASGSQEMSWATMASCTQVRRLSVSMAFSCAALHNSPASTYFCSSICECFAVPDCDGPCLSDKCIARPHPCCLLCAPRCITPPCICHTPWP